MSSPAGPRNSPTRRRLGLAMAVAAAATALGTPPALADPADAGPDTPASPPGALTPEIMTDVLGPSDPAFWDPAAPGTRVLTPIEPHRQVSCLTGLVPLHVCWTVNRYQLVPEHRPLAHVDVPVIGGAPLRIWVDLPLWGDGSTGEGRIAELTQEVIVWWLTNPTPP